MKYICTFTDTCTYEVEADTEEQALELPVPNTGHFCTLSARPRTIMDEILRTGKGE